MALISHILIGCPSSGKSTVANEIIKHNPNYRIVSTDKIREQLFGDQKIQGEWQVIETEVLKQIDYHLQAGHPIIYDATNAKRPWRIKLLQKLAKAENPPQPPFEKGGVYENVNWIGWYLKTPLETCLQRNKQRERQVLEDVIVKMYHSLRRFPPINAEGFTAVYDIPFKQGKLSLTQFNLRLGKLKRNLINRDNRTLNSKAQFHPYSRLIDFDRLMHLISVIIKYPNIGNLQESNPELIREIFGENRTFETSLEEICAILAQYSDSLYANPEAVSQDLLWLEKNLGIISNNNQQQVEIETRDIPDLVTHPYSEIEPFTRLIKTIHFITHHPFVWSKEEGCLRSLVNGMLNQGILDFDCADSIRKDIERVFKPFNILPHFAMKKGYFLGTGILSQSELIQVFRLLEAQAKSLSDPIALSVYETFKKRLGYSYITKPESYPVRAIYNKNIVDLERLPSNALANRIDLVELAIENGELLELNRLKGGGRFEEDDQGYFLAYPLQIVFHNIGWYLGFECMESKNKGLFKFERLDRLFLGRKQHHSRSIKQQENALKKLQNLYQCSSGIFLGNNPKIQRLYLNSQEKTKAEVTIELWFNDEMFKFVSEGTNRFPLKQMKMSPRLHTNIEQKPPFTLKKTDDKNFPNRFQVKLPIWSLEDIDLLRWVVGFGGQVKVVKPPELVEKVKKLSEAITLLYSTDS